MGDNNYISAGVYLFYVSPPVPRERCPGNLEFGMKCVSRMKYV